MNKPPKRNEKAKIHALIARYPCGCVSMIIRTDISSGQEIVDFCVAAKRRKCWVQNIIPGNEWEINDCDRSFCFRPKK